MRQLGILEVRTGFSALVAEVERTGEGILVTRHGKAAVRIVPATPRPVVDRAARRALIEEIIRSREEIAARHPDAEPFDIREGLDRDRGEEWS